ncbi:efflux RND transporter periplasmic adaptor subunit [Methylibium sp.]|uniref:efflux RND transporter periplasmic adaptor subunit n=1 Tax=Methylibium sp. TaxID=2067992 RepID=UPI003D0BABDC
MSLPLSRPAFAAVVSLCALALLACARPEPAPAPVRAVRTLTVTGGVAGSRHEFAAEVKARVESRLGFRVGGKIVKRPVDLGDSVKAGQVLAQLDPGDLRLGEDSARAALSSAQASFELAAADFKRYQELLAQGFISAAELERRDATLKAAQATLDQARAQSAVQGNQAGYASLRADAGGVITAVEAEPGQVVAAGASVVRLAHDGPRDAVFSVPEDKLALVRALEGRAGAVKVQPWGSNELLPATVREIAAATDVATRTFLVKADVGSAAVKLGQTAAVIVETPKLGSVIKLPLGALVELGGKTSVWLLDTATMTVKAQSVEASGAEGNVVIVTAGLVPGQEVVTAGVHVLTPGQKVKRFVEAVPPVPPAASAVTH